MVVGIVLMQKGEPMDDLISRRAAIEHLKKRLYETEFNSTAVYPYYKEIADNRVDIWMSEVPSVEPEIIRCKDCKYHHRDNSELYYCENNGYGWGLNGFCSDAERRTDEPD